MTKKILLLLIVAGLTMAIAVSADWSDPPSGVTPPDGNVDAPINTGTAGQVKDGGLGIVGFFASLGKLFVANDPEATSSEKFRFSSVQGYDPEYVLMAKGNIGAEKYCDVDGENCKTVGQMGGGGGGIYVGATTATYNGAEVGGYTGGDAKCATAFPGSRMCTSGDFANGLPTVTGWYSSFNYKISNASYINDDCGGWTKTEANGFYHGPRWDSVNQKPIVNGCSGAEKILCCQSGSGGGGGGTGITSLTAGAGITLTPNPITTSGTIAVVPAAPNPSGEGIMYLRSKSETGYTPNNCPATWIEADGKLEYVGMSENNGGLWSNMVRTCYTNNYCRVMYLRSKVEGGYIPNNCPGAWSEADMKIEYAYISHAGGTISNWVRTCYKCN